MLFPRRDLESSVPAIETLDPCRRVRHRLLQNHTRAHNVVWQVHASDREPLLPLLSCLTQHTHVRETTARPDRHSILWPSDIRQQLAKAGLSDHKPDRAACEPGTSSDPARLLCQAVRWLDRVAERSCSSWLTPGWQSTTTDQVRLLVCLQRWPDRIAECSPNLLPHTIDGQSHSSDSTQWLVETLDRSLEYFARTHKAYKQTRYEL